MNTIRKIISLFLVLILTVSLLPQPVRAAQDKTIHVTYHYYNPLYYPEADQALYAAPKASLADPADISSAAAQLRSAIKARNENCQVQIRTNGYDEDGFRSLIHAIAAEAEVHTGVPTEGDYIMWQYGEWGSSATGSQTSGDAYDWTITYNYAYYTTAQEETQLNTKVQQVLNSLNVGSASDYEKVKAIYDYICDNVTYDYDHLNDTGYKHQFTAYAALVQGTSVCQGYALLFYRLALELGVDARFIAGSSRGEGHGWNIVELGGKYYNADTTWDAGNSTYTYFLKCPSNFPDHTRDAEYNTSEFNKAYPMASSDYQPNTETECSHSYTASTQEATCTTEGKTTYTCTKCGDSYSETIKKLDHNYRSVVTEPTCTAGGYTTHTCSVCGDSYTDSETSAVPHTWNAGSVTKEPTETESGIRTYTCDVCGGTKTESIPATGPVECVHTYESVTTDPTCTTEGKTTYTCTKCGDSYSETIEKLDHNYRSVVTEPTCTAGGYTTHTCSVCGDSYTDSETSAVPHTWNAGSVTKEPTETESGIRTYTCEVCGDTKTESIPATGPVECVHTYESVTTDPTCTTEGKTTYTCTKCGDSYSETIAKLPHQWDEGTVTKEPTAAEAGEKTQHCATCDNVRITKIPALGKVLRVQGDNRYETAFQAANLVKAKLGAEKFNCIVVASGTNFADALPGSYLATMNQAPILLVNKHTVQDVADYIYENTYSGAYVYILGGEAAVPAELDALLENEFTVRRLAGANRYETNLLILEAAGVATEDVLVCTGRDFADSLSVSALGRPILLVNKSLTDSQKAWLGKLESNTLYVVGGKNAVSQSIEEELANYSYGYVERIEGSNRYETSLKVAETFFPVEADNVVLAYGHNFPDGLCGGVLAYNMNAPLILTRDNSLSFAAEFAAARGVATGAVLGGPGLIADSTVQQIFGSEPMLYE